MKKRLIKLLVLILSIIALSCFALACNTHKHSYDVYGKCTCGEYEPTYYTIGLEFRLDEYDQSYRVSGYNGTARGVIIPSIYNGKPVKTIDWLAFADCNELQSVVIGDNVTLIGDSAFANCYELQSVTFSKDSKLVNIASSAFYDCNKLQYNEYENGKYLPSGDNDYFLLYDLTDKNLSTYIIHQQTEIIGGGVFWNHGALESIAIPGSVISITSGAFRNCTSLQSVAIGEGITSIGVGAFKDCTALQIVELSGSVTSIGDEAFAGCVSLQGIVIPKGVTSIGVRAFKDCTSLQRVEFKNTKGWKFGTDNAFDELSSSDLSNVSTAATYLTSIYWYYTWTRN